MSLVSLSDRKDAPAGSARRQFLPVQSHTDQMAPLPIFGPTHLTCLALIVLMTAGATILLRRFPGTMGARLLLLVLTFTSLSVWPGNIWAYIQTGPWVRLDNIIPFHLCNIAAVLAALALITRHPLACELTYFWGLSGTMQGLLTPALEYPFPHPVAFHFFISHGIVVCIAIVLPLGLGWRPRRPLTRTVNRTFLLLNVYAVIAFSINLLSGITNFGYLRAKPPTASLLDQLGPWPYYIIPMEILAYALIWLLALPFALAHRRTEKLAAK